jgi:flagellar hook protein FlgE
LADIAVNLDAAATVPAAAFTLDGNGDGVDNDPANFNSSSTMTVYDSQGGAHEVSLYYEKTAANAWTVHYVHEDPANANLMVEAGTQDLTFDQNGALIDDNSGTAIDFTFSASVLAPQSVTFDFGTGTGEVPPGTGLDGSSQFAADFSVVRLSQNGFSAGFLKSVAVSEDGVITGIFTNGQTRQIGQVALAKFIAPSDLTKAGRNLYTESYDSGQPIVGTAGTSGLGRTLSNALELSNVDLAEEFVRMITAQRGFQANSRVITTTDEMIAELVNLKR